MQFALGALQPRATAGPVGAVSVQSTLRRLHAVPCAIEVGYGVLARLRPRALLARPFRRPPFHLCEDGRPELLPGRHCITEVSTAPGRAGRRDARIICPVGYRLRTREMPSPRLCTKGKQSNWWPEKHDRHCK